MKILLNTLSLFAMLFVPMKVEAVCPVCTIAVGAGLGFSRWLGIDDSVTGIWIGGLILSSGLWLADWIIKRGWKIPFINIISILTIFIFVIPPLYWANMIGLAGNTLWGIDKVIIGTLIGSCVFLIGAWLDLLLRNIHNGKIYFYYQKVIIPLLLLSMASFTFYLITI